MIKRQIPNLITLGNLLCGVESVFASLALGDVRLAALWICGGIFLDFFDGLAARLLGVASPLGKELDSLADVVTSGIAPAFILFRIVEEPLKGSLPLWAVGLVMLPFLLMPAFAAYRLAKFNIDTRQSHSFLGLPVPANALIWVGLALAGYQADLPYRGVLMAVVAMVTNILMVSEMPMFSLKVNFKDMGWGSNAVQYLFLIGCAAIVAVLTLCVGFSWAALSLIIFWYILLSLITQRRHAE
ncbi:MAG: CDP-diacylglycerol--serine O-phosphatidyltransferase [Bacteroidales bacterium]|nr:CDP-diacylglycerol--serine O-phosphatidyltransferase [Bacteroidales bacterium]